MSSATVREFLDLLEREEAKLLAWGVVDGGFTEEDVVEWAHRFVEERGGDEEVDAAQLVDELLRRRLLFDLPFDGRRIYRTRMSEAVRLFARLRQIFEFRQWRTGPSLVSDFRFSLRPRVYPQRNVAPTVAMETWGEAGVLTEQRRAALSALLDRPQFSYLAGFQVRATERVLRDLDGSWDRGMIVTVGTGSGKTLAFYLPALAHLASLVTADKYWTKAMAIYPRNELLKDQFSDTYVETRRLDKLMASHGRRKISIGAFFGPTPMKATVGELEKREWEKLSAGYVCPFLRCPNCGGDLAWLIADLEREVERLVCSRCGAVIDGDEVYLTRRRMRNTPPDVLFTTTEMLNRTMSDAQSRHVFGIGVSSPPQIVLLDEVHTYVGTHGAQIALLLRRWRHAVRGRVQFTGLSATLHNAAEFFGQLTGLQESAVEEITPAASELESEGMEYIVALRGDPVSMTSLLSTTIQSAMLLRRILDPRDDASAGNPPSAGAYGRRVFVFTDDLDVTNRMFHNLLDAEGVNERNVPKPGRAPLAALRSRGRPENPERMKAGQSWYLCEEIGHPEGLTLPLVVGRTSSQDVGVDRGSDVIVATASLEVGYNDVSVGAILQHKAPHDAASFVQRKGRAGRIRAMRPWTLVVLSDYGRDRIAYQGYESLFDPILPARVLPVANRYVLRIQAVFAFMDWLSFRISDRPSGSVYLDFGGPSTYDVTRERQRSEAAIIRRLLDGDGDMVGSLERHLGAALGIEREEVIAMMWEPPRSLMMQVLPTLLRRLESGWKRVTVREGESDHDYLVQRDPLPDFVPPSLFSDLNLPEVAVVTPVRRTGSEVREDSLSIDQALRTLVPGKVTRRFAVRISGVSHWIPLPSLNLAATRQDVAIEDMCAEYEELGPFQVWWGGESTDIRCVRPWTMRPALVPNNVYPTSNARPKWCTQIVPETHGLSLDLPERSEWAEYIREIQVFGHFCQSHLEVRRFAVGASANVRLRGGDRRELTAGVRFVERGTDRPAAVGFAANVDGLRFLIALPAGDLVLPNDRNTRKVRAFRTAYFRHRVATDPELSECANEFQREWLYQVYLSALSTWATRESSSISQANEAMAPVVDAQAENVLQVIFEVQSVPERDDGEGVEVEGATAQGGRLLEQIIDLFRDTRVVDRLRDLAGALWLPPDTEWHAWAVRRYQATLGGALLEACRQVYPEAASDDLIMDIDAGAPPPGMVPVPPGLSAIWIAETTIGGGGVVEEVARRYSEDPRRFFRLVESALGPSEREVTDAELTRILTLTQHDHDVAAAVDGMRNARRHRDIQAAEERLEDVLRSRGVLVNRTVMSAVHSRILRPGSSRETDRLLLSLIRRWHALEASLGIEVDARVFSYLASETEDMSTALSHIDRQVLNDRAFRFHTVYGLLWPRGNAVRSLALQSFNPYAQLPAPDRELVLDRLTKKVTTVRFEQQDWRGIVLEALKVQGVARLTASAEQSATLKAAIMSLAVEPLEVDFLHLYPQVEGIEYGDEGFTVSLQLPEAIQ